MNDIAIEIKDLWKSFRYEASGGFATLKEVVLAKLKHQRPQVFETELYHGMSLQIKKGETVAFLGRNGSGKSTLLKLISGIYQPDRGSLRVEGRLSPLIELGAGFHPEFSGIENVLIYAQILGIPKKQALKLLPAIIEFSGIGEFANQPVRTYSSGMYMRLAFSVAVNVDPEVLVVDEILAVGDFEFSRKCFARMDEFKRNGKTVCLVSHDLTTVASWATRGIVLDAGRIVYDGPAAEAVNFFRGS